MPNVNNSELILSVVKNRYKNQSNSEIAKEIKNTYFEEFKNVKLESIRKRVGEVKKENNWKQEHSKIKIEGTPVSIDKSDWLKTESKVKTLTEKLSSNDKIVELLKKELQISEEKNNLLLDLDKYDGKNIYKIEPDKHNSNSEATAFLIASDWHLEERVDPSTVNFVNEYNLDIAKDSAMNFFKRGIRLQKIFNKDIPIKNIVLGLLGDFINGYIQDEFIEDNYLSPIESIMLATDLIASGIEYMLKNTKCNLTIPCKVGNHSRTTQERRIATEYKNSFEWLMYHHLKKQFKDNERVNFIIDNGYLTYLNVYDKIIRIHHGHSIKYSGGIGGISIPANKAISQWDKERTAYLDIFGHYHQLQTDTGSFKYVLNGSNVGYNAFAVSIKASYEPPKQAFFLIDKDRGKTVSAPIFVR